MNAEGRTNKVEMSDRGVFGMKAIVAAVTMLAALLSISSTASASFGFKENTFSTTLTRAGAPELQAGAHADLKTTFAMNLDANNEPKAICGR